MITICSLVISIFLININGGVAYEGFDPTGGVSEHKKLKVYTRSFWRIFIYKRN